MDAVETTHHITVHHVDHRFGHRLIDPLIGEHAFLDDDLGQGLTALGGAHLVAGLAVERIQVLDVAHRHDAHAIGAVVGLDHHKGLLVDAVFLVFAPDLSQQGIDLRLQPIYALVLGKIDLAALGVHRIDQPGVYAQQFGKALANLLISLKVPRFAAHRPARM